MLYYCLKEVMFDDHVEIIQVDDRIQNTVGENSEKNKGEQKLLLQFQARDLFIL